MKFRNLAAIGAALAISLAAASSWAVTFTVVDGSTNSGGNKANEFAANYGGYTPEGAHWKSFGQVGDSSNPIVNPPPGNSPNNFLSPFANTGLQESQSYFSVGGTDGVGGGQSTITTLHFDNAVTGSFGFLWGSIDDYNKLEFWSGTDKLASFSGTDIANALGLTSAGPNYDYVALLRFSGFGDNGFDKLVFSSSQAAFEFGLAAIPLPASVLFLFGGLGGLGGLRLLSRRNGAATA